jgi:hypothetical protein
VFGGDSRKANMYLVARQPRQLPIRHLEGAYSMRTHGRWMFKASISEVNTQGGHMKDEQVFVSN